jgi:hypothetical protein
MMKSATPAALVLLAAVVAWAGFGGSTPAPAQPAPAPPATWEYKVVQVTYGNVAGDEKVLNDLGAAGWEVVETASTTQNVGQGVSRTDARVILKRAKR